MAAGRAIIALVVVVIVVAAAAFVSLSRRPSTSSTQSSSFSTSTTGQSSTSLSSVGQSSVSSRSQSSVVSTSITIPAECSGTQPPIAFPTLFAGASSPAIICVQLYYFNSTGSLTLNLTNGLSIRAAVPTSFDGASNFTVTASQAQLVLGGSGNESEGAVVAFSVTAKPGASGTYELGFFHDGSNEYVLGIQEPETCGAYGQLVAGDGRPNYVYQSGGCLTYATVNTSYSPSYTLAGVPYPLLPGDIYFRMVGVTNSTG